MRCATRENRWRSPCSAPRSSTTSGTKNSACASRAAWAPSCARWRATADEAIWRATALWQFPIADASRLRADGRYVVLVRGDLNPISEDLMADVRRWLVQPARGQRKLGAGDSFFGSFVSIFVNPHIEDSERQVRFVSQPFALPTPLHRRRAMPPARTAGGAGGRRQDGKAKP